MFSLVHPHTPWDLVPLLLAAIFMYALSFDGLAPYRTKIAYDGPKLDENEAYKRLQQLRLENDQLRRNKGLGPRNRETGT